MTIKLNLVAFISLVWFVYIFADIINLYDTYRTYNSKPYGVIDIVIITLFIIIVFLSGKYSKIKID